MENKQEFSAIPFHLEDIVGLEKDSKGLDVMFAQAMRVSNQNSRQGTVACKGRSDVARSNRKPWKQKGTGRARAGSARSPLWKGGGVIHGPQARVGHLKINREVRRKVLSSFCSQMIEQERLLMIRGLDSVENLKTKSIKNIFEQVNIWGAKVVFFMDYNNTGLFQALRNIAFIKPLFFDQPDIANFASADYWIVLESDKDLFKQMVNKWL
jgi:large subunit ribosomal protein L4